MALDEKSLALFLLAAAEGGLAKAGRELGLSPTATTQRLQALEADLGVKLLNRTTRAVSVTPEGGLFAEHARRILSAYEAARTAMSGETGAVRGELRVTVSASFGRRYVAPQIAAFLATHPDVTVKLQMTDAMVDIVESGFDLAIRVGALPDSSLIAQQLAPSPRVVIASPALVARIGAPKTPADLAAKPCLTQDGGRLWRFRNPNGTESEVRVTGPFDSNHGDMLAAGAIGGVGFAIKSYWDVKRRIDDGQLTTVLDDYQVLPIPAIWAVRPPGGAAPPRVRAFVEFLKAAIEAEEEGDNYFGGA